jgi:serine protease AprX
VALNPANGQPRWQLRLGPDSAGAAATTPVVGPDGTIYVTTSANPGSIFAVSPTGSLRWTGVSRKDVPFSYPPIVGPAQTLYLPSVERVVYVVNSANGALRGVLSTQGKIVAPPALASDGSLYVTAEERSLYAFGPDGRLRFEFRPPAGKFTTSPAPTPDGQLVYAAVEEGVLYAVNAATGTQQWSAATVGAIKVNPTVDARGNVFLGSDGKELLVLTPAGTATTRLRLDDRVTQPVSVGPTGNLVVRIGDKRLVMAGYLRDRWNGSRDVEPTELKREWALSNPVAIDVSADIVHERGFTGQGVTIAVVDSGVYFTSKIDDILGAELERQFVGQADFVGNGLCRGDGVQYPQATTGPATPAYCFTDHKKSIDAYGHGSHVAGIIWSQITDHATGVAMGVAKNANILSVRVLDENGQGSYTDVIEGIQYVVQNKDQLRIRVLNLSLSAQPSVPYFVDPLNRAVERAWASGIVVVAAAGNSGPGAETITVPGNDPYVITVGAINSNRTPGYWADDFVPEWSATGPTGDGFVKPDVLAPGSNIISFIYTNKDDARSANLARMHPDYVVRDSSSLFRMSGTSMSTAVASGVVALMLEANPSLTPDQVKYRLMETARPAVADGGVLVYSPLQQGAGRIWASDAVLGTFPADGRANQGMDILADLAHGYESDADLAFHYQGPIRRTLSDDGQAYLYHTAPESGDVIGLGVSRADTRAWIDQATLASGRMTWSVGRMTWSVGLNWEGGLSMASGRMTWSVGRMTWSVGRMTWSVNQTWSTGGSSSATAREAWAQSANPERSIVSSTLWVHDD